MSLKVSLVQHPVGQGGMMSGLLEIPDGQYHWVYDCGSEQRRSLDREIATLVANGPLDCLFISHLDSDHVEGIDRLITGSAATEVVLPYLNPTDRVLTAARAIATATATGSLFNLLDDVEGWFRRRGVERVTFIEPEAEDDEDDFRPEPPPIEGGDGVGPIKVRWLGSSAAIDAPALKGSSAVRLRSGALLAVSTSSGALDWVFSPYAHRPSKKRLRLFKSALFQEFGHRWRSSSFLAQILRDSEERDRLRSCYEDIWADHNLVSMALYAGPLSQKSWNLVDVSNSCALKHYAGNVAWLMTGDMHLNGRRRRGRFCSFYQNLSDKVNVFALPHHGSDANFHASIVPAFSKASQFSASFGPNGYGHPGEIARRTITAAGRQFVSVTQDPHT